jgi:AmmeMemoRadiSam system protein A
MGEIAIPAESQQRLLQLSRRTLENFVRRAARCAEQLTDPFLENARYGAFVSLHAASELRGCIGSCTPDQSLSVMVMDLTEAAACRDPRVKPVRPEELVAIRIEISVLSRLEHVDDPLTLQPGKHGLYIASGARRGVLLPQVATEHGWDIETFLEQVCRKAGLEKTAWKNPKTTVSSFTALVIGEDR